MTSKEKKEIAPQIAELTEFSYDLKVPKDRVAVLIGKNGEVKKQLEEATNCKLKIDSEEGDVFITGNDSIGLYTAREIVRAVGRGFNPEIALELLDEHNYFEMIELTYYVGNSKNNLIRVRSRIIGTEGKARKTIEELTDTKIVVYGKTISIIGEHEGVSLARKAFESLLAGSRHSTVYAWLDKQKKEMTKRMY